MGSLLYEKVLYHLDLVETDYFGLQFSDTSNVNVSQLSSITRVYQRRRCGDNPHRPTRHNWIV